LPQNFDDELAKLDKRLHAAERFLERRQIPPSTLIQLATITQTINRVDMEISPNLALIDASKGSLDGTSSVTKHDTNEIPTEATTHGNSKLAPQENDFYNIVDNDDAPITNIGATITANSTSSSLLLPDAAAPSLSAAPHSDNAASHVVANNLHNDLTIKTGDNDARRGDEHPRPNLDERLHPSNTPKIVIKVSNTLLIALPAPQLPLLSCLPLLGRCPASPTDVKTDPISHRSL
jgi:hypothetical protein